jgi:thiosulfate/3-mercaptopyruvate sulfurtransferase
MRSHFSLPLLLLMLALAVTACVPIAAPANTQSAAAPAADAPTLAIPESLVDTAWIVEHQDDPNVHLLAIHGKQEDFDAGHLPDAIFINLGGDLTNPADSTRGQILTQEALGALFSRLGIEDDDTLVIYDSNNNLLSARAYWAFKYYQHPDVRLYNGGSKKWIADGNTLSAEAVDALPSTSYVAGDADPNLRTTGEYVLEHLDDPSTVVCDTRGPGEYAGTDVRADRGGHIPGAINVEWVNTVNAEDGTFKELAYLADLYQKAGFSPDKQVITYCQTGVRGAHTWYVLSELLDYPQVRNYDGSWLEWANDPAKPLEQ